MMTNPANMGMLYPILKKKLDQCFLILIEAHLCSVELKISYRLHKGPTIGFANN